MNNLKEFNFLLFSLSDKVHESSHQVNNKFFEQFENSPIEEGNFEVNITLKKSETLLQYEFKIKGVAKLLCDRSLEEFDFPMEKESKILFKFGENYDEPADDLIILEHGTSELNVARWVYELIAVEIPFKKLHPKFEEDEDEDFEEEEYNNLQLVYSDVDDELEEEDEETDSSESWEQLKKKFNKE